MLQPFKNHFSAFSGSHPTFFVHRRMGFLSLASCSPCPTSSVVAPPAGLRCHGTQKVAILQRSLLPAESNRQKGMSGFEGMISELETQIAWTWLGDRSRRLRGELKVLWPGCMWPLAASNLRNPCSQYTPNTGNPVPVEVLRRADGEKGARATRNRAQKPIPRVTVQNILGATIK